MKVREKKRLYYKFVDDKTLANWQIYQNANREAKNVIAIYYKDPYDKLDTRDGEKDLYGLVKS